MTAAYFEDHPTDPDKVILRKPRYEDDDDIQEYKKPWVGLTQDELNMIGDSMRTWNSWTITDVYFAIEAKLKEKNT
jgi:hypothetical protein